MIPKTILDEIFNIEFKPSDVLIDHVSDAIEDLGFVVGEVQNFDTSVYIEFSLPDLGIAKLDCTLIIHRMKKVFETTSSLLFSKYGEKSVNYVGTVSDDFSDIEKYLRFLKIDCKQYVESICIENNSYKWQGLRFKIPV